MEIPESYLDASIKTEEDLRTVARSITVRDLSRLSLPDIDAIVDRIVQAAPAGNIPGVILNGLARLQERRPPFQTVRRDIDLLIKGVEQTLDGAVYGAFFVGPAAAIWAYQNLLKLAGKDPVDSFPEGLWQFYAEYMLREDTARHANETHGFDTALNFHHIRLEDTDRITAWVMAAIHCLHQYDDLLRNEWRERVYVRILEELADHPGIYHEWQKQCPYSRGPDVGKDETYPEYRHARFDAFFEKAIRDRPEELRRKWTERVRPLREHDLPAYQRQMSILAYLEPGPYGETRRPIALKDAHVGVIYGGHYYLVPAAAEDSGELCPPGVKTVRRQVASLVACPPDGAGTRLEPLARVRRASLARLRGRLHEIGEESLFEEIDKLRLAPILINFDTRSRPTLFEARSGERGVGDHALTIFDTGESFVFDQSHIFFDGGWGAALAEILTNEALSWGAYLGSLAPAQPCETHPYALNLRLREEEIGLIEKLPRATPETVAETDAVDLPAILELRKFFKKRNDTIRLTVNHVLVLYRAIHAATYTPHPDLEAKLKDLAARGSGRKDGLERAAIAAYEAVRRSGRVNPAIVIPVDASYKNPRDRLYPVTFEVPLNELKLLELHRQVIDALDAYKGAVKGRKPLFEEFNRLQCSYLAMLASFGEVLSRARDFAMEGESAGAGTIKMLAHIPSPLLGMLEMIPDRFELLNDLTRGREVFSNLGTVSPGSTLRRFITAKDDNEKKSLAWGIITDAGGVMRISLRDFRPHVGMLADVGLGDLAVRITRDYVESYAHGLNGFVDDLRRITIASRETFTWKKGR